jgi:DNA invertase Pin-like site-specific DNA recombinase
MAKYGGGPVTYRALRGPRLTRETAHTEHEFKQEILYTLRCIQEIRRNCDSTELSTVRQAHQAGLSWTEISTALGVTRQATWERWRELDEDLERTG